RSTPAAKSPWNSIQKVCFAPAEEAAKRHESRSIGLEPREASDRARAAALFEAAGSQRVVFRFHDDHPVSALFLGAVQGFVGKLDQSFMRAIAARQNEGRADAHCQPAGHSRC